MRYEALGTLSLSASISLSLSLSLSLYKNILFTYQHCSLVSGSNTILEFFMSSKLYFVLNCDKLQHCRDDNIIGDKVHSLALFVYQLCLLHACQLSRFYRESPSFSSNLPVSRQNVGAVFALCYLRRGHSEGLRVIFGEYSDFVENDIAKISRRLQIFVLRGLSGMLLIPGTALTVQFSITLIQKAASVT